MLIELDLWINALSSVCYPLCEQSRVVQSWEICIVMCHRRKMFMYIFICNKVIIPQHKQVRIIAY